MPKGRRQLSREELEIQEELSPNQGSSSSRHANGGAGNVIRVSTGTPASIQVHRPVINVPVEHHDQQKVQLPRQAMSELASLVRDTLVSGIKEGFKELKPVFSNSQKRKRPLAQDPHKVVEEEDEIDEDMPEVGLDAILGDTASRDEIFGVNVNDSEYEDLSEDEDDPDHSYVPVKGDFSRNPPQNTIINAEESIPPVTPPSTSADEPDPDLPSLDSRLPSNWEPNIKAMNFLKKASKGEWSKEARQKIVERFHPKEDYDPFLLPVSMPTKLYKSLKSPAARKKDYLFNRFELERFLYNANADLCAALRPFLEVLSALTAMKGCGNLKNLLGHGIMGICSANIRISRGRRELARRFVRLDWAEALYAVTPSHASIFGGASLEEAVKAAKESSKMDDSLVYAPKKKKPFRPTYSYFKDFQYPSPSQKGGKTQGYRQTRYNQYGNNNNNYNSYGKTRGQSQRSRGRGRGGKRGAKSTRATNSQE